MKPSECVICGSGPVGDEHRTHRDNETEYKLWRCNACAVQFWTPFKNPGAEWYGKDERYAGRNIDPILRPNWNHKKVITYLAPHKGSVLDVGCGIGNFLAHARARGWSVKGIDFDPDAIRAGAETFQLDGLETNDLAGFRHSRPGETFDLVTFFDVLEHIDNHSEFMSDVRSLVKKDGHIAMSMPYRKGARWLIPHDLPPRHLTRWDRRSLSAFLKREGFEPVYLTRRSEGLRFIILKLRFRFGKHLSFNVVGKAKAAVRQSGQPVRAGTSNERRIQNLERLAAIKDAILYGIPALCIWFAMLPTSRRYITLYCIAKKK
jgi:SAM-dependent methyltransferase